MGDMASQQVSFGKEALKEFPFDPKWKNLNHGSYGTIPKAILQKRRQYQDQAEARPDQFIRKDYPVLLDVSRAAVAKLLNAPVENTVFVSNATVAINTVYKNLVWNDDGKDTIISFSTIYGGCGKTEDWIVDTQKGKVSLREIDLVYPLEDDEILELFHNTVKQIQSEGLRPRICLFDVVSSSPGVLFPWVAMTAACRSHNILSLVDGAQGVGMVHLDISAADPDFFTSNCHKWLHVPRGCAVLYVAKRCQRLLPTTLATSHSYVPLHKERENGLPHKGGEGSHFVKSFAFVGTLDDTPYACVKDAIKWREEVLGGEDKIISYMIDLNKKGSAHVAKVVSGTLLDNKAGTLTNCAMGNIMLPLWIDEAGPGAGADVIVVPEAEAARVFQFMSETLVKEYNTFFAFSIRWKQFMVRLSAQVYLDMEDYEWVGGVLKELLGRVAKGEYKQ